MRNKIKKISLALFTALLLPTSVFADDEVSSGSGSTDPELTSEPYYDVSASAAGWQTLYNQGNLYFSLEYKATPTYTSDGGSFRACASELSSYGTTGVLEFYEEDPGPNNDKFLGWGTFKNNTCVVLSNVDRYADGANGKAEIYVTVGAVKPSAYGRLKLQD